MSIKNVVILGSTGSIGVNTLKVIELFPHRFKVVGLTAYNNLKRFEKQIAKFSPSYAAVGPKGIRYLKRNADLRRTKVFDVDTEIGRIVERPEVDIVVIGIRGSHALEPFLRAVRSGKIVAPANKEALVMAGDIIMREAKRHNARIIPVDSEQSAIFQCLDGQSHNEVKKIYLTASGGTLRKVKKSQFDELSMKQILAHPRWKMGRKISVDSATLMNKGFEVIEANRLFGVPVDKIQVLIHPEAIIHSMVEFKDGAVLAQLGITDMRLPIQYALTYPDRFPSRLPSVDFLKLTRLTFEAPDLKKFPALALALYCAKKGGTLPGVLNAADEEAVEAFLSGRLRFSKIYGLVEKVISRHTMVQQPNLNEVLSADQWAREEARRVLATLK